MADVSTREPDEWRCTAVDPHNDSVFRVTTFETAHSTYAKRSAELFAEAEAQYGAVCRVEPVWVGEAP